jgi:hypothetical protein
MTHERAAALAAARRHLDPDAAAARFRFREISLDSAESRNRADTLCDGDGQDDEEVLKRFLARHPASSVIPRA